MNVLQLLEARFPDGCALLNAIAVALAHASIDSERYRFVADHRKGSDVVNGGRFLRYMLRDGQVAIIDIQRRRRRNIVDESLPFAITLDAPERADIEVVLLGCRSGAASTHHRSGMPAAHRARRYQGQVPTR